MRTAVRTPTPPLCRGTPTDPARDVLDDDDTVVDQEAEGDDDGRDRYLLKRDTERAHPDYRGHHGERNDHRRDQSGPKTKEDDDETGDDREGLGDARQGAGDGDADLFGLVRREVDRIADREAVR